MICCRWIGSVVASQFTLPARRGYWKTNHADCGESQIREYFSARYCLDFRMAGDACAGRGKGGQDLMQTKLSQLAGEDQSSDDLIRQIYSELKQMARRRMAMERNGVTLGTTALVHEAWMRLEKSAPSQWRDRPQFFAAAAEAMRRILVEAARRRMAAKRGRGEAALPLDGIDIAPPADDERLLEVHEALEELEREDPFKAGIVKMRFFSGMENEEISALLEVSEKTVRRHWEVAKVWLYRALSGGN